MSLEELFGSKLVDGKGQEHSTATRLANKKAIGIYFSAHWCPPCRGFTPVLAKSYNDITGKDLAFDVVFVSSDKSDEAFKEYLGEMPWVAVPFEDKDTVAKLKKKYKVSGIPTLVILDGEGKTITTDGRSAIASDPTGEDFPWLPPSLFDCLGDKLVKKDGSEESVKSVFERCDAVGIYFSAHWCPPCRGFTPKLISTYNKIKEDNKNFEIIFVSSDKDQGAFDEYFGEMPWLALPFADRKGKEKLSGKFGVEGIPTFVVVDKAGKTINANARGAVGSDPEGLKFPWEPQPISSIESPEGINENASVVLFVENASATTKTDLKDALEAIAKPIAAKAKETDEDAPLLFFFADAPGSLATRVRTLTKQGDATEAAQVVILDIPDNGSYYTFSGDVTKDSLEKFVADYLAGNLKDSKHSLG